VEGPSLAMAHAARRGTHTISVTGTKTLVAGLCGSDLRSRLTASDRRTHKPVVAYVAGIRHTCDVSVQKTAPGRGYSEKRMGYAYPKVSHFIELK
jgi:succinyl-CoA synthetase alpha subunit